MAFPRAVVIADQGAHPLHNAIRWKIDKCLQFVIDSQNQNIHFGIYRQNCIERRNQKRWERNIQGCGNADGVQLYYHLFAEQNVLPADMHANWPHKINDQINRKRQGLPDAGCQRGATAILLFVCMLSLFSTNCPNIIVLHSANTSELQATKKPHNYHKIAVWQKDDRIRKSPLKFCVYHYNELEGDCQAAIITELCRREKLYLSTCLLIHIKVHRSKSPR